MRWLIIPVALLVLFAACGDGDSERIDALEERIAELEAGATSGSETAIVILAVDHSDCKGGNSRTTFGVEYVIAGEVTGKCVLPTSDCAQDALVGAPLPESCGAAPR